MQWDHDLPFIQLLDGLVLQVQLVPVHMTLVCATLRL